MKTYGEMLLPMMRAQDQAEADVMFAAAVEEYLQYREVGIPTSFARAEAEATTRRTLGYFAGYCDHETRARVERLYRCEHPYLGAIATTGILTPQEVFDIGFALGKRLQVQEDGDAG